MRRSGGEQQEFVSPILPSNSLGLVEEYIKKIIAYKKYAQLPVVLGEYNGFLVEVKDGDTFESVYGAYVKQSILAKVKREYLDNNCEMMIDKLWHKDDLTHELRRMRDKLRNHIFVCVGHEAEIASKYLESMNVPFEVIETEWDVVELRRS